MNGMGVRVDESVLLETFEQASGEGPTLLIGGSAAWAEAMADAAVAPGDVAWLPLDVRERRSGHFAGAILDDPGNPLKLDAHFETVIFPAPPERDLGRRWLMFARDHLHPDGKVMLAGANATGIRSTISDGAAIFGSPLREDYGNKLRVATFASGAAPEMPPPWATTPGIAPGTWADLQFTLDGVSQTLATLPGVFAGTRLDVGTELLLAHLEVPTGARVLDVGCGAGVIGLAALQRGAGAVTMTDVNLLAVASVQETIRRGIDDWVRVVAGDVYDGLGPGEQFDLIVSNPPFHQGKAVDYGMPQRLIEDAPRFLTPGGCLLVVANAFLPYERLFGERFRVVKELANTRRFKVIAAMRSR